jgi:hypothetical protein
MTTTLTWPASIQPAQAEFALVEAGGQAISPYNGVVEVMTYAAERWRVGLTLPPVASSDGYGRQAFLRKLALGKNRVRLGPYLRAQYAPKGTLRGSPSLSTTALRGSTSLSIAAAAGATLLAGDFVGCGGQLFEISDDCAESGGVISAPVTPRVRANIGIGTDVVWSQPTAEFIIPAASIPFVNSPAILESVVLDFVETWGVSLTFVSGGTVYEDGVFDAGIYE